jgi:hypothetical protein
VRLLHLAEGHLSEADIHEDLGSIL